MGNTSDKRHGFTLLELMVTVAILVIDILGAVQTILATHGASKTINEKNIASRKLPTVLEIIQAVPFAEVMVTVSPGRINMGELIDYNSSVPKSSTAVL